MGATMRVSQAELDTARATARPLLAAISAAVADRFASDCAIWIIEQHRGGRDVANAHMVAAWYRRVTKPPARPVDVFNRTEEENWM